MKHLLQAVYALVILILFSCSSQQNFRTGDLLFQDLDCGPLCDAIENATAGNDKYRISHMGMVEVEGDSIFVWEALDSVMKTPLEVFMNRSKTPEGQPKIIHARLRKKYRSYIPSAIRKIKTLHGKPYDEVFELHNGKYYCSELIYETLTDHNGKPVFFLIPMNFKDLKTGKMPEVWKNYFDRLNQPVPQGKPGSNPYAYYKSDLIRIIKKYY